MARPTAPHVLSRRRRSVGAEAAQPRRGARDPASRSGAPPAAPTGRGGTPRQKWRFTDLRLVALVTALAFGCATARPPDGGPVELGAPPRVALAEPELELWMEGTGPIDPRESEDAYAQAREALSRAVAGRDLEVDNPDQLLVVRTRAIARTEERRSAQVWSAVFIVVVVVAVIVSAILLSHSKSGPRGGPGPAAGRGGHGIAPAPSPGGPLRPPGPAFVPRPYPPPPPFGVGLGFALWIPAEPLPPMGWVQPAEAWLASRGWFDGDAVEVTAELADPQTGAVSWHHTVRESADPRDPVAVSAVLDRAVAGLPFGQRTAPLQVGDAASSGPPPTPVRPGEPAPPAVPPEPPVDLPPPPPGAPPDAPPPPPPAPSDAAPAPPPAKGPGSS